MQLWQQRLMYKQQQELQRQLQLQQLDQGAREHSSAISKPVAHLPRVINERPVNDTSNKMWLNNFVGGMPIVPNNSQMLIAGNMNWAQESGSLAMHNLANGHMLPDNQRQALKTMGFMPQQLDLSFHGMPISSNRPFANQCSQFFGMSNDGNGLMTKTAGYQTEKISDAYNNFLTDQCHPEQGGSQDRILVTTQNFQGKGILGNNAMQNLRSDVTSGNFQQENHMQHSLQFQELHGMQEQDDWSGHLQEKPAVQEGISTGVTSLDPTEEKLLFGTDDDDNWGASFGGSLSSFMGGYPRGHPSQSEYTGAFPSVQSGSWSALMQEAVQATSSDLGVQEEWSGLSFQKMEQSMLKDSNAFNDSEKQLAAWNDSNLENVSSLTSRPPPLFYDADGDPNSHNVTSFEHSFNSSHDENNMAQNEVPNVSFQLSTGEAKKIQFLQNQEKKQYLESGFQLQMPVTNGKWAGHTYDLKGNNSSDAHFKSQNISGSWAQQENMSFSSVNRQHSDGPTASSTSYAVVPGGDGTSHMHETDINEQKLGARHFILNSGMQPFKSSIDNSQAQTEGSLMGNFGSVMNSNTLNLTREMNQQVTKRHHDIFGKNVTHDSCVNSQGNENMGRSQNQPNRRLQTWETSINRTNKRSDDTYNSKNKHPEVFPGEGYISSHSNHGQDNNYTVAEKENLTLIGSQNSFLGNQKYSTQSGQENVESSIPPSHLPNFQGLADVVFQGSRSAVTRYVGNLEFEGHDVLNNPMDVVKKITDEIKELQPRESINIHASSGTFDGITVQSAEDKRISQSSQNIELLHKVDQSRDGDEMNAPVIVAQAAANITASRPHFNQPSLHGFGLWVSPPSQRQPLPSFEVPPWTLINHRHTLDKESRDRDQPLSSSAPVRSRPPYEASEVENWRNITGREHKGTSDSDQLNLLPGIPSDFPYVGNQLQEKQQQQQHFPGAKYQLEQQWQHGKHVSNSSGNESLDQTNDVSCGSQANASILVNNDFLLRESPVTHNADSVDQSVQTSLPIPTGSVPPRWVSLASDTHASAYTQDIDHAKAMSAGFTQVKSSGQQFPVMETRLGSQSSVPGMSQQVGFSNMLHYVWANLSAQQRLAGLQAHRVTPNILQSIINHARYTSSWTLQKADGQGNQEESTPSEVGTSSVNSQDRHHQVVVNSFKPKHAENADSALSGTTSQGNEPIISNPFDGGSNLSVPSLVEYQQDVDKGKSGEGSGFHSQVVHAPVTNIASSRSDICFSGHTSVPLESPQQNYFLLHQMQAIKGADSDSRMTLGKRLKGSDIGSNASQMEQNAGQRFVHMQNTVFKGPADGKLGAVSQSSLPSDIKMLSFASKDNERHTSISSIAEHCNHQSHILSLSGSSSSNLMRGHEHYKIRSQTNSSWFEKFINYKNDMAIATHNSNCFPGSTENSSIAEQRIDSGKFGSIKQSTSATTIAANDISGLSLPPTIMDHGIVLRSKKRKSANSELLPWHKEISLGLQRLQSTSIAELAWAQAANGLIEKVGDEAETIEDGSSMLQPGRRLILTTQMIQQLFPSVPAAMLNVEATSTYEKVIYYVAKSALADACSKISSFRRDSCEDDVNLITRKVESSEVEDHIFSKFVEEFRGRTRRIESEFSRLEKRPSMLDVRLECQELERFSIVNHLVQFHGRSQTDAVEGSSPSRTVPHRTFLRRYVTAPSVPGNLPGSVLCLSL